MATRDELLAAVAERYRSSPRADRVRILDEFTAVTGYHRKHAMRLLRMRIPTKPAGDSDLKPAVIPRRSPPPARSEAGQ